MTGNMPAVRPPHGLFFVRTLRQAAGLDHAGAERRACSGVRIAPSRAKPSSKTPSTARNRCWAFRPDYRVGIVPASDTGAVEMALWSLLGPRPVDCFAWESFGEDWVTDTVKQLKLKDSRIFKADYGELPDLTKADPTHDIVFLWNGTTSGVRVPDGDWIAKDREGLTICDATSAAFAMEIPWDKLDVADLLLAEGAGRRSGARHAGTLAARRGAIGKLHAALADAEDLPHDQGRQDRRRHLRRRDDQHALHARARGLSRRAHLGRRHRRAEGADRAAARPISPCWSAGSAKPAGPISSPASRARAPTPACASRSSIPGSRASAKTPRPTRPRRSPRCWRRKASPTTSAATARRRGPAYLVRRRPSTSPISKP